MAPRSATAPASQVREGDRIVADGEPIFVSRIVKAPGRKPATGENLCFLGFNDVRSTKVTTVKVNSKESVRLMRRPLTTV